MRQGCVNLHETASAMTRQVLLHNKKCVIYMTPGRGYIQRNPRELLHKPHNNTVAQVTVYVATLYFQFICIVCCRFSDA